MAASTACGSTGPGDEPWGGRADTVFYLRVGQEVRSPGTVLRIGFGGVGGVELGIYRITLVEVRPAPVSTSRIPQDQYVVGLRLERIAVPGN